MKYMSTSYPQELQSVLDYQHSDFTSIKFSDSLLEKVAEHFEWHEIPSNFLKYSLHSSFLMNFWNSLLTMILALVVTLLICLFVCCTRSCKNLHSVFAKLKRISYWSFCISLFLTYYNGALVYSSLEFRTVTFETAYSIISFCVCIVINILFLVIPIRVFMIGIEKRQSLKKIEEDPDEPLPDTNKWTNYEIVYSTIKGMGLFRHMFLFIYIFRIYIFYAMIAYLFEHPMIQACVMVVMNFIMILYYATVSPFQHRTMQIQFILQEINLVVANICLLVLSCDYKPTDSVIKARERMGYVIIYAYAVFVCAGAFFITMRILSGIFKSKGSKLHPEKTTKIDRTVTGDISSLKHLQDHQNLSTVFDKQAQKNPELDTSHLKTGSPGLNQIQNNNDEIQLINHISKSPQKNDFIVIKNT